MNHAQGAFFFVCAMTVGMIANAHEFRPAYLDVREERDGEYSVLWKTPMRGDLQLSLTPEFSGGAEAISEITGQVRAGAAIQEWTLRAPALRGETVRIRGLESTMTDTLVRINFSDGSSWTHLLTPRATTARIPEMHENQMSTIPVTRARFPLITAIAAWGVMCMASVAARTHRSGSWRWIIAGGAYTVGITASAILAGALVQFLTPA